MTEQQPAAAPEDALLGSSLFPDADAGRSKINIPSLARRIIPAYAAEIMSTQAAAPNAGNAAFKDKEKPQAVRTANIVAARAVSDAIRT
ncbi:hypothetical protein KCV05_g21577, partial [Aureobasidium melanogenum]